MTRDQLYLEAKLDYKCRYKEGKFDFSDLSEKDKCEYVMLFAINRITRLEEILSKIKTEVNWAPIQ